MFRLNQRVCRIRWEKGYPFLEFGRVTRLGKRSVTYYVNDAKTSSKGWFASWRDAVNDDYKTICGYSAKFRVRPVLDEDGTPWKTRYTIRCICVLRRLERKLQQRHLRHRKPPEATIGPQRAAPSSVAKIQAEKKQTQ